MQSRKMSAVETATSTAVGFILSWLLLWFLALAFGWHNTVRSNTLAVICFTVLSLARGYVIRRLFNWYQNHRWKPCEICGLGKTLDGKPCWRHFKLTDNLSRYSQTAPEAGALSAREKPETSGENFCVDEGCPQYGSLHICISVNSAEYIKQTLDRASPSPLPFGEQPSGK